MKKIKLLTYLLVLQIWNINAQNIESKMALIEGNETYFKGNYDTSAFNYQNSYLADTSNINAVYNNGNAAFMSGDFEEARNNFNKYLNSNINNEDRANAHYNIGNSFLTEYTQQLKDQSSPPNNEHLKNAVEQYKSSLRYNSNDDDARFNLSYAMKLIQQNKDQEKKDDQNKDQEDKDKEKKDDQNKDQEKKDDQNKDQKDKDKEKKDDQNKDQQKPQPSQSKQQAMKNLDAINNDEEKVLLKVNRKKGDQKKKNKTKDW
jgi:hypothetical protein